MGLGRSKFPISFEEACQRAGDDVVNRLRDTFYRYSSNQWLLPQVTFLRDIFGDGMPPKLAEQLYEAFRGTQKGIKFNDLLRGLVLLVHGTQNEKIQLLTHMLMDDSGVIMRESLEKFIRSIDGEATNEDLETLFHKEVWCTSQEFSEWIKGHQGLSSFTLWLLSDSEQSNISLSAQADPPTYYQTLATKYGPGIITDRDVMNIEKTYWSLKGSNGKFDCEVLKKAISPPVPNALCHRLFDYLDMNVDGHLDLSEMVRGVALLCRKDLTDRIKLCFKLFDKDNDGILNEEELKGAIDMLIQLKEDNSKQLDSSDTLEIVYQLTLNHHQLIDGGMGEEEFIKWSDVDEAGHHLMGQLLNVMFEVCHVKLGMKPRNQVEEEMIIRGYMNRFSKHGRKKGQNVYLISAEWFNEWRIYTNFEMDDCPLSVIKVNNPSNVRRLQHKEKKNSKSSQSPHAYEAPMAEPVTELVEVTDEGEDVIDSYTHVVNPNTNSTGHHSPSSDPPVPQGNSDQQGLPPIDNTTLCETESFSGSKKLISLTNEGGHLLKNLKEFEDYYVLPEDVWRALVTWHGTTSYTGGPSLPRPVIDDDGNAELYPVIFQVYKHTTLPPSKQTKSGPWNSVMEVLGYLGFRSGQSPSSAPSSGPNIPGDPTQPVLPRRILYYTATFHKGTTVLEMCEFLQRVLHAKQEDLRIYDLSNEDQPDLLDEESKTIEDLRFTDGSKILVETRNRDNSWPEELIAVIKQVQAKDEEEERERTKEQCATRVPEGATGLSNLGNTCFMNSSLQCISNLTPLTTYFREKDYTYEINKQNPLGTKGAIAKRYGDLVQDLWSGQNKSIVPWRFRLTVAHHAPQFNNFQQQDAQELLAFVLDSLHEDLNRVKVKPYRELRDSDDRPVAEVADEAWTYHRERNDSVIVDLLQGQLKSIVECTECSYKSMKFDPFTFLSLPLPLDSSTTLEVIVIRLDGSQPIRYSMRQELDGKYGTLRETLQDSTHIHYLLLVDVFGGIIRSFPQDTQKLKVALSGALYAYEIPPESLRGSEPRGLEEEEEQDEGQGAEQTVDVSSQEIIENGQINTREEEPQTNEAESTSKEEEPQTNEAESTSKEVEPQTNEAESTSKEVEPQTNEAESTSKEVEPQTKDVSPPSSHTTSPQRQLPNYCSPRNHKFIFAVHRRTLRLENYFISTQKNRPVLFSTPMIVPCLPSTPASGIYKTIWDQVQRLIIKDPPNAQSDEDTDKSYPYTVRMVKREGLFCCRCPWYKFCRGCVIECDDTPIGDDPQYLAIDWDDAFLHLKYQSAQERPKDDESMEALKQVDNQPIDLDDCFASFSKPEELGEDELWYCKKCETHRTAKKSLEVWKLPPVLIVHLKRFHFHNGRWTKSQRTVNFPLTDLDPLAYTGFDDDEFLGNSVASENVSFVERGGRSSVTPPLMGEGDEATPLSIPVEVHERIALEEDVTTEDDHVTTEDDHVTTEDDHVTTEDDDHVTTEDDHVTTEDDHVTTEDDHVTTEDDHVTTQTENVITKDNEGDEEVKTHHHVTIKDDHVTPASNHVTLGRTYSRTTSVHMSERPIYDLFAVTCHNGVLGGGHYTSFAKNPNSKWYYYNDSTCKETTEERIMSESPYLLFYEARGLSDNYGDYRASGAAKKDKRQQEISPSPAADEQKETPSERTGGSGKASGRGCRQQ